MLAIEVVKVSVVVIVKELEAVAWVLVVSTAVVVVVGGLVVVLVNVYPKNRFLHSTSKQ